jgi:hypothetical protein
VLNSYPSKEGAPFRLIVNLKKITISPLNRYRNGLINVGGSGYNRYITEKEQKQYKKLLSKCYQNGIDRLLFFWDNRFINKVLVNNQDSPSGAERSK